jgi:glycosyltransferase involved in cell wall biosynthesis
MQSVTIIIPVYNESLAIYELLRRVTAVPLEPLAREVIIVDDGSTDDTVNKIEAFVADHPRHAPSIKYHRALINHGKGAALRAGFVLATGDIIIIQDGDLEYLPEDYPVLLSPFKDESVNVVYGSRFLNGNPKGMKLPNFVANKILTWTTRVLYNQTITDEATGYKVFRRSILPSLSLKSRGFEFCPEFTSRVLQAGHAIHEVPIRYDPRGILEGKKIKARDGFIALWWLIKLRLSKPFRAMRQSTARLS